MDRIVINDDELDALFEWRDRHVDLVRRCPSPLKGVDIIVKAKELADDLPDGYRLRFIREKPNRLKAYSYAWGNGSADHWFLCEAVGDGTWKLIKDSCKADKKNFQPSYDAHCEGMVALYFALMAVMVYGSELDDLPVVPKEIVERPEPSKKQKSAGITYILRKNGSTLTVGQKGSHASPKGIFTVRGHWRRYKSGKIVWISEYKKGTGEKKRKTYKI